MDRLREKNVKENLFFETEKVDYACWERLKPLKNRRNGKSLTFFTLDSCSQMHFIKNGKRGFCLLGRHSKHKQIKKS